MLSQHPVRGAYSLVELKSIQITEFLSCGMSFVCAGVGVHKGALRVYNFVSYLRKNSGILRRYETKPCLEHGADNVAQQEDGDAGDVERCFYCEAGGGGGQGIEAAPGQVAVFSRS